MALMHDKKVISDLHIALSREKDQPKQYVQTILEKHEKDVLETLVTNKGVLYVCGNTAMGKNVEHYIKQALGEEEFEKLHKEKRFIVELWSS